VERLVVDGDRCAPEASRSHFHATVRRVVRDDDELLRHRSLVEFRRWWPDVGRALEWNHVVDHVESEPSRCD
jgi:hypothetical protein